MTVTIGVHKPHDRHNFQLVWIDPQTGKQRRRSSGCRRRREAERKAIEFAEQLNRGLRIDPTTWQGFRRVYEQGHLASLSLNTRKEWRSVRRRLESVLDPQRLSDLTELRLTKYTSQLRTDGLSEDTIAKHLRTISAALGEAKRLKLLGHVPEVRRPRRAKGARKMKGRPLTGEEFERYRAAIVDEVGEERARSWQRLVDGLWLSGLRLEEALELWWDDPTKLMPWDLSAERPTMVIHAELEKGHKDRPYYPLAPEFAEFMRETPEAERVGPVFAPELPNGGRVTRSPGTVGRYLTKFGQRAGVVVGQKKDSQSGAAKPKHASAQDLRRSFGTRWAIRVKPAVLQQLMRHESIETTMGYYVEIDSDDLAAAIWSGYRGAANRLQLSER